MPATFKGAWLREFGFIEGTPVKVNCEDGRFIITLDSEKAELAKVEQAFMDRELSALQKRFQKEKKQLQNANSIDKSKILCYTDLLGVVGNKPELLK